MTTVNLVKNIDRHHNMVLIGAGKTAYRLNEVAYFEDAAVVEKLYGGELAASFTKAKALGAPHVFVVNCQSPSDYVRSIDVVRQQDFTYLIPVSIYAESSFYCAESERYVTYAEMFLEKMSGCNDTTILMTTRPAALFEDLDAQLADARSALRKIRSGLFGELSYGNLAIVLNGLKDYAGNLALGAAYCTTDIPDLPILDYGEAVFDTDLFDVEDMEVGFFKNNVLRKATPEHLVNFHPGGAQKLVAVDRIVKYIKREFNLDAFVGRLYSDYTRIKIIDRLESFLESQLGYTLDDYSVDGIEWTPNTAGSGTLTLRFSIWPVHVIEKCDVVTTKDV